MSSDVAEEYLVVTALRYKGWYYYYLKCTALSFALSLAVPYGGVWLIYHLPESEKLLAAHVIMCALLTVVSLIVCASFLFGIHDHWKKWQDLELEIEKVAIRRLNNGNDNTSNRQPAF